MPCPAARLLAPIAMAVVLAACGPKDGDPMADETSGPTSAPVTTGSADPSTSSSPTVDVTSDDATAAPTSTTDVVTATSTSEPGTTTVATSTTTPPDTDTNSDTGGSELCVRVGGIDGVGQLVTLFLGRVLVDTRINAYFLRSDLDWTNLGACVVTQLGEAMGCPGAVYTCLDMKTAHAGLGISTIDLTDFAEDFGAAWDDHAAMNAPDLTADDKDAVINLLAAMAPDIVEDPTDDMTVYQRVGRKPAILALIGDPAVPGTFLANVAADFTINGFFDGADFVRLNTCLTRQVHSIDGPNTYGLERDDFPPAVDPGPTAADPCRDMSAAHLDLVDPNDNTAIEFVDFAALVMDLVTAMNDAGVAPADQMAITDALAPLCPSIVAVDPEKCM